MFRLWELVSNDHYEIVRIENFRRVIHGQDQIVPCFIGHNGEKELKTKNGRKRRPSSRAAARGGRRQCGFTDRPTYQFVLRDLQVTDGLLNFFLLKFVGRR